MHIEILIRPDLSEILDKVIQVVKTSGNWYDAFPKVTGYQYYIPEGYEDLEEYPYSFREDDHAIAYRTIKYPDLHPKVIELIKIITKKNTDGDEVLLADMYEHAGTHYACELALQHKAHIKLYADFLFSNNMYYERFQHFDFLRIVRKWGWCSESYYLLFAHMFTESEHFHADMTYLNYNGYPLRKGLLDDKNEADKFLNSLWLFLKEIAFNTEDVELNTFAVAMFGELIQKHIYPYNIIDHQEKSEVLKNRYHEVVEKLLHGEAVSELPEETNTATIDIFQQYKDEDFAEI